MTKADYIRKTHPEYEDYSDRELSKEYCPGEFPEFNNESCLSDDCKGDCLDHWKQEVPENLMPAGGNAAVEDTGAVKTNEPA